MYINIQVWVGTFLFPRCWWGHVLTIQMQPYVHGSELWLVNSYCYPTTKLLTSQTTLMFKLRFYLDFFHKLAEFLDCILCGCNTNALTKSVHRQTETLTFGKVLTTASVTLCAAIGVYRTHTQTHKVNTTSHSVAVGTLLHMVWECSGV